MEEIAKVSLDNEMDLILAHKRTMKLAELAGLSLASQTTFATAVSEVARYAMEQGTRPQLTLGAVTAPRKHYLAASIESPNLPVANPLHQGLLYAQRLVEKLEIASSTKGNRITLYYNLPPTRKISDAHLTTWRAQFSTDLPLSAYDEIKNKNEQLQELAGRLQDSEQHYKRVTDALPLMIFTANQTGQLLYANAWVSEFTGQSIQNLNQTKWAKVMHPDDYAAYWKEWTKQAAKGLPFHYECRLKEQAGQDYQWHLFSALPVNSEPARVAAWTGFAVNIHAQKIVGQTLQEKEELALAKTKLEQSQRELQATVSELNRSNAELSQFAYVASHDLQEPLRKIQAFGDLLISQYAPKLDEPGADLITRMQSAAGRMKVLVKDLLSYSRLTTQQQPFEPLNLNQILSEVLVDIETSILQKQATVETQQLPVIQGDPLQLRQLFQNLLSNALKFSNPGQRPVIQITSSLLPADQLPATVVPNGSHTYAFISVTDNGIGFEQKYEDRIFRLFQRLHGNSKYQGTGMGLAICKKVIDNHQGFIAVRSQLNQGSTFMIYLPTESHLTGSPT
ncbi:ATP-binding protein [Larkinella insperata]|uniref:histidine kinase n=1 Tax=Larkinella insperata TaxID=332158 RepID=A0ABW3Q283_9BACT|nr:ATP-binding protein [Larkinella insperata]